MTWIKLYHEFGRVDHRIRQLSKPRSPVATSFRITYSQAPAMTRQLVNVVRCRTRAETTTPASNLRINPAVSGNRATGFQYRLTGTILLVLSWTSVFLTGNRGSCLLLYTVARCPLNSVNCILFTTDGI